MPELHDLLERRAARYEPAPDLFDRVRDRRRRRDRNRRIGAAVVGLAVAVGGIGGLLRAFSSGGPTSPAAPSEPTPSPTIQEVLELTAFTPLEPGTYSIDPDGDPSTPLRVVYEVSVEGWSQWIGAAKFGEYGNLTVSITTVENLVRHGCRDASPANPMVGSSVDDLAAALADLAPFRVTSPPKDVTRYGYSGKHLGLTVPDLPVEGAAGDRTFTGCVGGDLRSWISPNTGAFYGYTRPGYREEFWILDVDGTRLMIAAERSPGAPPGDLAELRAILDSIRIEP